MLDLLRKKEDLTVHFHQIVTNANLVSTSLLPVGPPQIASTQPVLSQGMSNSLSLLFLSALCPPLFFNSSTAIPTWVPGWAIA